MLEKFIYAKQKSLFEEALNNGEVLDEAIVFIEDTKEIWNHGTYFDGSKVDLSNIEEMSLKFINVVANSWISDNTYGDFSYLCKLSCPGVTDSMFAEIVFDVQEAISGNYAPICETGTDTVTIWSSVNDTITIPTIIIFK